MLEFGAELIDEKYTEPDSKISKYITANLPVMVGVLNSKIRFSQVWSLGANFVLTDTPDVFLNMVEPMRITERSLFIPVWVIISIISYGGGNYFHIYSQKHKKK